MELGHESWVRVRVTPLIYLASLHELLEHLIGLREAPERKCPRLYYRGFNTVADATACVS